MSAEIDALWENLRSLGCNTVQLKRYGCDAIDVPRKISMRDVDFFVNAVDSEKAAAVFRLSGIHKHNSGAGTQYFRRERGDGFGLECWRTLTILNNCSCD
jgi:hypothetical protein